LKNIDICYSRQEPLPQVYTQFLNKHNVNISLIRSDWYLQDTSQLKYRHSVEFTRVLADTLKLLMKQFSPVAKGLRAGRSGF